MRRLAAALLLLVSGLYADTASQGGIGTTVAGLPAAASFNGVPFLVVDSAAGSCGTGGGTIGSVPLIICLSNGTNWVAYPVGGSGTATSVTMAGEVTGDSGSSVLRDWFSAKSSGATGGGSVDDAANLQTAINAAATAGKMLYVPDGTYNVSVPLEFKGSVFMAAGALIKATAAMSAVVNVGSAAAVTGYWVGGIIDANSLANDGIFFRQYAHLQVDHVKVRNAQVNMMHAGDSGLTTRYELILSHSETERTNGSIQAGSVCLNIDAGNDSKISGNVFVDCQEGIAVHTSRNTFTDNHVWSHPSKGAMTVGFDDYSSSSDWSGNEADTVSTYGFRLRAFNTTIRGGTVYNSTNYSYDNTVVAVHFDQAGPAATVQGLVIFGADGTHRIKADYEGTTSSSLYWAGNQYNNVVTRQQSGAGYATPSDLTTAITTERAAAANGANLTAASVAPAALATVNSSPGTYGGTGRVVTATVNAKGQLTGLTDAASTALVNPMSSVGDMIQGAASGVPSATPAGTAGYVWTSNGPGQALTWQSPGSFTTATNVQLTGTTGSQPACSTTLRAKFWYTQGAIGTADGLEVCTKYGDDSYHWVRIF